MKYRSNKLMYKVFLFLFSFGSFFANGQTTRLDNLPMTVYTSSQINLIIDLSFTSNCNNYYSEVLIPQDINMSGAAIASTSVSELGAHVVQTTVRIIDSVTYNVIKVKYDTTHGQSTFLYFNYFYAPSQFCELQKQFKIITHLLCGDSVLYSDQSVLTVQRVPVSLGLQASQYDGSCDAASPMKVIVQTLSSPYNTTFENAKITFHKNNPQLKCIGISQGSNYNGQFFYPGGAAIPFKDTNNTILFNVTYQYGAQYMLYFEHGTALPTTTYAIDFEAAPVGCGADVITTSTSVTLYNNNCNDSAGVNVPDLKAYVSPPRCFKKCPNEGSSLFMVLIDNLFKGTHKESYTGNFTYRLSLAPEINITAFGLNQALSSGQTDAIRYQVYGDTLTWFNYPTTPIAANQRYSVIEYTFNKFADYSSQIVYCYYELSLPSGYSGPSKTSYPFKSAIIYRDTVLKQREFAVGADTSVTSCAPTTLYDLYYDVNNNLQQSHWWAPYSLSLGQSTTLSLELTNTDAKTNFSFVFNLNKDLFIYQGNMKFYYGPTNTGQYNDSTNFKSLVDFKAQFASSNTFTNMNVTFNPSTNQFVFSGIDLQGGCTNNKAFFVRYTVTNNPFIPYTYYASTAVTSGSSISSFVPSYYYPPLIQSSLNTNLYINSPASPAYQTNINVLSGGSFAYHYMVENSGSEVLSDIVAIGTFPYVGDTKITKTEFARNSDFTLPCSLKDSINLYVINRNGTTTKVPTTSYNISYSPVSTLCIDELNYTACNAGAWSASCPSGNQPFAIEIKTINGFSLPAFAKLDIKVSAHLSASLPDGQKGVSSFVATAKKTDGAKFLPNEDNLATITVGTPLPPPPPCAECVPEFSPLPGQEYLLSAWVRETYTDKYPDTYLHSGVQITFNAASVVLPIMRPTGPIVEGWQRIEASFVVPSTAANIQVSLVNDGSANTVFFDDIRIHPFRSNMKSFVYNPSTQKVEVILDENNYSTRYEYDDEGILVRVKKETERGVMTIKETRNNQSKINK